MNGEIYNHEELRKGLTNHKFRTGSDCDVIAHLVGYCLLNYFRKIVLPTIFFFYFFFRV